MRGRPMTDREAYPAAWITLAVLAGAFLLWRFVLGEPTVSRCWIWEHWHVYCPGCGGDPGTDGSGPGTVGTGPAVSSAGGGHIVSGSGLSADPDGMAAPGKAGVSPALSPPLAGPSGGAVPGELPRAGRAVAGLLHPAVKDTTAVSSRDGRFFRSSRNIWARWRVIQAEQERGGRIWRCRNRSGTGSAGCCT